MTGQELLRKEECNGTSAARQRPAAIETKEINRMEENR